MAVIFGIGYPWIAGTENPFLDLKDYVVTRIRGVRFELHGGLSYSDKESRWRVAGRGRRGRSRPPDFFARHRIRQDN